MAVDGADEFDRGLNLIKGHGAALLRALPSSLTRTTTSSTASCPKDATSWSSQGLSKQHLAWWSTGFSSVWADQAFLGTPDGHVETPSRRVGAAPGTEE
jgi:hypothetical protein